MRRRTAIALGLGLAALAAVYLAIHARGPAALSVDTGPVARQARFRSTVTASGEIVATRYADIGSDAMGRIVSLPVAEGDHVTAGQVLARIDAVQATSQAGASTAQLQALQADEGAAAEQVRSAEADAVAAEARANDARQLYDRNRQLRDAGLLPASDFATSQATAAAAEAAAASAKAAVDRARQALASASQRAAQARAQQASAQDLLNKTSIVSPIDGIVSQLHVRQGEMVVVGIQNQPGTTLMTVSDLTAVNAEVKVAEADVLHVAVGQAATVTLEALAGRQFGGKVIEVGASALPVAGTAAAAREFRVVIRLDSPDPGFKPGLTCDAEIVTSEQVDALTVPLQSVVLRSPSPGAPQRAGVFVVKDGRAVFTPVTTGAIGGIDIQIDGVSEGTPVVVGPFQVLQGLTDGAAVRPRAQGASG